MESPQPVKPEKTGILAWLKKRVLPLSGLLISVVIVAVVGYVYFHNRDFFNNLQRFGDKPGYIAYGATFLISVFLNATVIIPVSNMTVILALGAILPMPWMVGLAGGLGAVIGEMTGYIAGRSGRNLLARNKTYVRVEKWVKKRGWIAIFFLSALPFVFDVVGIIAGALRMPVWEFMVPTFAGRTVSYIIVAYLGAWGFKALPFFS
jgi:membrane protein DedA with SNARE-associated domain